MMIPVDCDFVYVYVCVCVKYVEQTLKKATQRSIHKALQINQNAKSKEENSSNQQECREKKRGIKKQREQTKKNGKLMP